MRHESQSSKPRTISSSSETTKLAGSSARPTLSCEATLSLHSFLSHSCVILITEWFSVIKHKKHIRRTPVGSSYRRDAGERISGGMAKLHPVGVVVLASVLTLRARAGRSSQNIRPKRFRKTEPERGDLHVPRSTARHCLLLQSEVASPWPRCHGDVYVDSSERNDCRSSAQ
jgi:hypothetical protein